MSLFHGSKGDLVTELQKMLSELGHYLGLVDGDFGPKTRKAVVDFQNTKKLEVDGIVGPITWGALGMKTELPAPEKERSEFRALLLKNPNYFGNLKASTFKAVKAMVGNTKYEELTCIGFNPNLDLLEATIKINLSYGYGGSLCGAGTTEYVRFFIDYGSGWENVGMVAVNVHDIPSATDCAGHLDKPLTYVVTLPIDPRRNYCVHPVLPKVRGILSWEHEPPEDDPNWHMTWGNTVERHIQIKPRLWSILGVLKHFEPSLVEKIKEIPPLELAKDNPIPEPDPPPLSLPGLVKLYSQSNPMEQKVAAKMTVEPHRFGFAELHGSLSNGVLNSMALQTKVTEWEAVGLNFTGAVELLLKTKGDTSYEELDCLGLDYNRELLVATVRIKRPGGYSGNLCHFGSWEYVSFWADWDNSCEWTYLGTSSVRVHDIPNIPADGLHYTSVLKVNLDPHRRNCHYPKVVRIRAVLSWNSAPSTTNPNLIPHWGNRLDTHVQIKPGVMAEGPRISILGGVGVADINVFSGDGMTKPNARFALTGTFADPIDPSRSCPFGGRIVVQGPPVIGRKYRVWVRKVGTTDEVRLIGRIWTVNEFGVGSWKYADPLGFFEYLPDNQNINDILAYWDTSDSEKWEVRLEMADIMGTVLSSTGWHCIQLDNTAPTAQIDIDGGACDTYAPGTTITGRFVARDAHFGYFALSVLPYSMALPSPTTATPHTSPTAPAPGDAWSLNTTGWIPCGYVVRVQVWDRTICGSSPSSHNYNADDKGFCLIKKA